MKKSFKLYSSILPTILMLVTAAVANPDAQAPAEAAQKLVEDNAATIEYTVTGPYEDYESFVVVDHQGYAKFVFNEATTQKYIDSLNYYADILDEDINIYSMLVRLNTDQGLLINERFWIMFGPEPMSEFKR